MKTPADAQRTGWSAAWPCRLALIGGDNSGSGIELNVLVGDASINSVSAQGGNDILTGGNNSDIGSVINALFGEGQNIEGSARGGNDILTGGNNSGSGGVENDLFGDAAVMTGSAHGGNDVLVAGTAVAGAKVTNIMWGDGALSDFAQGGTDHFVFKDTATATVGENNTIEDFSQSQHDVIEFAGVFDGATHITAFKSTHQAEVTPLSTQERMRLHSWASPAR